MAKKRQKTNTITVSNDRAVVLLATVRMRIDDDGDNRFGWEVLFADIWLTPIDRWFRRRGDTKRSGNAWARRMKLTPRWE